MAGKLQKRIRRAFIANPHAEFEATPVHELERYMRCRQCSKSGLSVEAEPFDCAADDQDFGERSAVHVVAGRAVN